MTTLTLALDWTPNINHIGFFVARELGYYRDHDLEVMISDPAAGNYATTPAKAVEIGAADLGLCPTESLLSYRTKDGPFALTAIAALLQEDLSAIAVRADRGINSPRDLDGKTYASYQARYEDAIVKQMIRNDGGTGDLQLEYPPKLGIWDTLVDGTYDATWIFLNWEGVEASDKGLDLKYFKLKDYGIPYAYSPVIAAGQNALDQHPDTYKRFLAATKMGYLFAKENPGESMGILKPFLAEKDRNISLKKAHALTTPHFGDAHTWGRMDEAHITAFLGWLHAHNLETARLDAFDLVTNDFIE